MSEEYAVTRSRPDDVAAVSRRPEGADRAERLAGEDARQRLLTAGPLSERRLELAGFSTAVLEGGDGSPVVLLHGLGEFAAIWMRIIPELARTHRVIAPDLPGDGASEAADGTLTTARLCEWLAELIERTCPSPPALVGRLSGGALAVRFASGHADRFSRLVLVDAYGLGRFRPAPRFALAMVAFLARPTERTGDRLMRQCMVDLDGVRQQLGEDWDAVEAYALDRARTPSVQAAGRSLMSQLGLPVIPSADLARIAVPTTLIWGRHDRQVRLRIAEVTSARYGWPLHVIDNAADDPAFEQPTAFLAALDAALGHS